jgi:hypothetical protein
MQANLTSLVNPRWANAEQTLIDCEITTGQFGDEVLPFTASPNDYEVYGRELFAAVVAGNFGPIAPYIAPPVVLPTPEQIEVMRRAAYQAEADPLFFKWQRGESTEQEWLGKIAEIKARFPHVVT